MKATMRTGRTGLVLLALALAGPAASQEVGPTLLPDDGSALAPEAWLQEDPGSDLYSRARTALQNDGYEEAAELFQRLRESHPESGYAGDSYYWQAFALFREGGRAHYRSALRLLETQAREHPEAGTRADADELRVRIEAQLARRGDADAAAAIAQQAADPCGEDQEVRMAALSALINMDPGRAVPILQEVLRSRDACSAELREQSVFLLAQHMNEGSVDILLDLAHRNPDPDPEVREQAVFWLSQVDSEEAVDALASILQETDDPEVAEKALFALAQQQDSRAWELLQGYAERSEADPELRSNAIFWIGQSDREGAGLYLRRIYDSLEDPELKEQVVMSVAQSGGPEAKTWLLARARDTGEDPEIREQALFWLGETGALTVEEFRELFGAFTDSEMREQILFVAAQSDAEGAVDFLMEVARDTEDPEVQETAIFWLGQSDDPRVAEFLLEIIRR